jgi:GTPase SAR1 family protein
MAADQAFADILALPEDAAYPRVISFARRFGEAHIALAMHAAFPLGLSPELLHLLRVNLVPEAPFIAEADLLLSALCREAGEGLYEMDAATRELLLEELVSDPEFGPDQLFRTAEFLLAYAERALGQTTGPDLRRFLSTQRWAALAQLQPEQASGELMDALSSAVREDDTSRAIRLVRITDALAAPLAGQRELTALAADLRGRLRSQVSGSATERKARPAPAGAHRLVTAKVVVLGDSGVGKSGLSMVLAGHTYELTASTHGVRLYRWDAQEVAMPGGDVLTREIILWDFAGQPGYRVFHQQRLEGVSAALIVFDPLSQPDPLPSVRSWARALAQERGMEGPAAVPPKIYLVAARMDRGRLAVSPERIRAIVDDLDLNGYFETSAKEGQGIAELAQAIGAGIAWDELPMVIADGLFRSIRQFLLDEREQGRVLGTTDELFGSFTETRPDVADDDQSRAAFETCLRSVESDGLVRRLHFGDLVLLQPELLDDYAQTMLLAARAESDGLGLISEDQAERIAVERSGDPARHGLLWIAAIEELLQQDIVLRENDEHGEVLIFPSEVTREHPGLPEGPGIKVAFTFQGAPQTIYACLAVRLAHSGLFREAGLWRNAAFYTAATDGTCGIHIRETEEGRGELAVFCDEPTGPAARSQFEAYVADYLESKARPGTLQRIPVCQTCGYILPADVVQRRLDRGNTSANCPVCENRISLLGEELSADTAEAVAEMKRNAEDHRDRDVSAIRLRGKVETRDYDVFLVYNSKDRPAVMAIGERLRERGILPWLDIWEIRPGLRWQEQLERQLSSIKSAAVFIGARGAGPWQALETDTLLREFVRRSRPIIPVILEGRAGNPPLPDFLDFYHVVDMRNPVPDPFDQLVWGVTGTRPGAESSAL